MADDEKKKKPRRPYGSSIGARLNKLERALMELRKALDPPPPPKVFMVSEGTPEPAPDELGENDIVVRFVGEQPDPETIEKAKQYGEDREATKAELEAKQQAENDSMPTTTPEPTPAGIHAHFGDGSRVIAQGYGWSWGKQAPIKDRYTESNHRFKGLERIL